MSQDIEVQQAAPKNESTTGSMDSSYVFSSKAFQIWYGINGLASIITPVALTMLLTSLLVSLVQPSGFVESLQEGMNVYMVFKDTSTDTSTAIWQAIINAVVMILGIGCMTFIIVLLYKFHFIKTLYGLLYFSSFCALGYTGGFIAYMCFTQYKIISDYISLIFAFYNFGVGGVIAIFYGWVPKIIVKMYLIIISVIVGYLLSFFPYWTTWCLLVCLAVYDMLAVLTPCGPLKLLVNEAKNRDDPIPGLLYEAEINGGLTDTDYEEELILHEDEAVNEDPRIQAIIEQSIGEIGELPPEMQLNVAKEKLKLEEERKQCLEQVHAEPIQLDADDNVILNTSQEETPTAAPAETTGTEIQPHESVEMTEVVPKEDLDEVQVQMEEEEEEENQPSIYSRESVHLGLGDFIFYSLLVTTAGYYSIVPYIACFVIIIAGLLMTMALLSILEHALPALPFSMILGVTVYFTIYYTCVDMMNDFAVSGYMF